MSGSAASFFRSVGSRTSGLRGCFQYGGSSCSTSGLSRRSLPRTSSARCMSTSGSSSGGGGLADFERKDSKVAKVAAHLDRKEFIRKHSTRLIEQYTFSSELGSGGFANVFLVTHTLTGQLRAAKRIHKSTLKNNWEMLENEVKAMMDLDHPHICKLYEYFVEDEYVYLILEYLRGPDLFEHMMNVFTNEDRNPPARFSEYEAAVLMRHMLKAVFCCHSSNIIHRDIKPENFMFANKDAENSTPDLRMIDLGLSKRGQHKITGVEGTLAYMAPEILRGEPYNRKCDVWPLGAICYIMLTGEPLFTLTDDQKATQEIQHPTYVKRKLQDKRKILSRDAQDFLKSTLAFDPARRISAKHALAHPFVMKTYMGDAENGGEADQDRLSKIVSMSEILSRMRRFSELGVLKRASLIVLAHMIGTSADTSEKYRLTFRQLDIDGSGALSLDEFCAGIRRESLKLHAEEVKIPDDFSSNIWPAVDLNQSDDVNFTEFLAACLSGDEYNESHWRAVFQVLDSNRNGYLTPSDLRDLFHDNEEKDVLDIWHEVSTDDEGRLTADEYIHLMQK